MLEITNEKTAMGIHNNNCLVVVLVFLVKNMEGR
jgi:hypothetical protein